MKTNKTMLAVAVVLGLCGVADASETSIRTSQSNTTVSVRTNRTVWVELTGRLSDVVYQRINGQEHRLFSLADARRGGAPARNLGGGVYRVRVQMVGIRELDESRVVMRSSSGTLIDDDRFNVR